MRRMPFSRFTLSAAVLAVLASAGCMGRSAAPPVTISGKLVMASGQPLARTVLVFFPHDAATGQRPTAHTDAAGHFATTGPAGRYKVTLTPLPTGAGQADPGSGEVTVPGKESGSISIAAHYRNVDETPLTAEVPADGAPNLILVVR